MLNVATVKSIAILSKEYIGCRVLIDFKRRSSLLTHNRDIELFSMNVVPARQQRHVVGAPCMLYQWQVIDFTSR